MKPEEIIEGNKLIAEFRGLREESPGRWYDPTQIPHPRFRELKYHSSWDWLMPVVEKIEDSHKLSEGYGFSVMIDNWNCEIQNLISGEIISSFNPSSHPIHSKIEAAWLAVVEFIKWYNQNKKEKK